LLFLQVSVSLEKTARLKFPLAFRTEYWHQLPMSDVGGISVLALALAGLALGSFIANIAQRHVTGAPLFAGRSRCASCHKTLTWMQSIPILSWALLGGSCRSCNSRIPVFYPIVEAAGLGIALSAWWHATAPLELALLLTTGWLLLMAASIDALSQKLPRSLNLCIGMLGLLHAVLLAPDTLPERLIGGVLGFLLLLGVRYMYRSIRHRDGLGLGDAFLLSAIGCWTGWQGLGPVILIAALGALGFVMKRLLFRKKQMPEKKTSTTAVAFGPWLALAGWMMIIMDPWSY
jgi:prepilin signal peptidase PulO-like enzyme (type II secretory pathway)